MVDFVDLDIDEIEGLEEARIAGLSEGEELFVDWLEVGLDGV